MAASVPARLERIAFKTSRLLDFVGRRELTAQIGHEVEDWPSVLVKELVDNGIDAAEEHDIAPVIEITVSTENNEIVIADNGPSIPVKTIKDVLDFNSRVSSREAYVSPTRGAQGNALKVIICMPFALADGHSERRGETVIETRGTAHRIVFAVDPVRQTPRISHETAPSVVKKGTRITVRWPTTASGIIDDAQVRFLQMARTFGAFNPHLALRLTWDKQLLVKISPTNPGWQKWRGSDPTSAHWYDAGRLERLMAAYVADDLDHKRERTAREFVSEFRGLSGSVKPAAVLDAAGLGRPSLADFFPSSGSADRAAIAGLLAAMKFNSKPVAPEQLGIIGRDHLEAHLVRHGAQPENFRYKRTTGERAGVPFAVEAAFAFYPQDGHSRLVLTGVNWSAAINQPFRFGWRGLDQLLSARSIYPSSPIGLVLHYACPRPEFTDRGKSAIAIPYSSEAAFTEALNSVTANWAKSIKAQEREEARGRRESEKRLKAAAESKRAKAKATIVGSGVLYREIATAAADAACSLSDLTVLAASNDPYRLDTTVGHENGKWLADQIARLVQQDRVHLRGLFYRIVAAGGVRKPDGEVFTNTHDNWVWLTRHAAKAARWLSYVPFDRIRDERNEPPRLFLPSPPSVGAGTFSRGVTVEIPAFGALLPGLSVSSPRGKQPYRIIFIGEKSSLLEVLGPIVEMVSGELLLPTGESTETMIAEAAARAAADGRPAVMLYFSDFDPAGHQMAISVARKLQGLRTLLYTGLRIELHRVALTLDQVRQFALPSTPLKQTEKRKTRWREVMRHEQTEIDALAALRPADLRRIARAAVEPFYDFTLDTRCVAAGEAWRAEAEAKIADHPALPAMRDEIAAAHTTVEAAIDTLHEVQSDAYAELKDQLDIDDAPIPAPEAQIEATAAAPVFTTADDFATASLKLIAEKKYEDVEAEEEDA